MACHDAEGLGRAETLGADMAMLSPVNATSTHPHISALGWDDFARLTLGRPLSVYALGGVQRSDLELAKERGARGIAGISAFWPDG